ncbi:MAG: 4'-phosphopantetheinyl transferase family protein [Luteolibacter sp.]
MTPGIVTVYRILPNLVPYDISAACMTDDELSRFARFRFREDALHWAACRAGLRRILGAVLQLPPRQVPIILSEFGKPGLAPPFDSIHFNLSHCTGLAVVAVSIDGPVGIDLEPLDRARDLLECESTFCHPAEVRELPVEIPQRACQLLRIWTAKEAVLKAMGTGLSHPPEDTRIIFEKARIRAVSDSPLPGLEIQRLHELDFPELAGHRGFVSAPDSVKSIVLSREN